MQSNIFDHFFDKYPNPNSWEQFFNLHLPFWKYVTETAKSLFNVPMSYPVAEDQNTIAEQDNLKSLEDFFALYFLLIIFQENKTNADMEFKSDQLTWKHLWQRELWAKRVSEEKFVLSLHAMKAELIYMSEFQAIKSVVTNETSV